MVDVDSNQLTTPLTLPFLIEETLLPMVEETKSEEESSTQKFDGVEMTHDDDLNAGDDILNPNDGDGHDQDMEEHDTPVKEELLGRGHIHKIKPTRLGDLLQIRYMRHLVIRLNTSSHVIGFLRIIGAILQQLPIRRFPSIILKLFKIQIFEEP